MSVSHQYLFNRILDITAIIHVPIKVLSIVIVIRYSPPHMRLLSFFLLNGLVWNFAANLVFTVMHVYPMYPAECFRTDGIVSFIDNEIFSHAIFGLLFVFILNTVIAVTSTFIYRYIIFVFPNQIEFIKRRLLLSTFALHIGVTIATAVLYTKWALLKESYPDKDELPLGNSVLCLNPYGPQKDGALWTFIGGIAVATFVCLASAFLLLVSIYRKRGIVHKKSLDNHKKVLQILVTNRDGEERKDKMSQNLVIYTTEHAANAETQRWIQWIDVRKRKNNISDEVPQKSIQEKHGKVSHFGWCVAKDDYGGKYFDRNVD
ncbi:hypothetical protein QR680_016299 [Steinernema hermaphroditum]|uniref:Uncharacterized protein n=1 Tax=Steinernema hermaphroditum TaxID=289476 RepID=A0AA39HAQ9_9BILA|nr:hypothetical protein QR680_016299 [Steinernema hermaphroditum]